MSRISKRQRATLERQRREARASAVRGQQLHNVGAASATQVLCSHSQGSIRQLETLRGYAETLRGSVGTASPSLGLSNPFQASIEDAGAAKADAGASRAVLGFLGPKFG